MHLKGNKTNVQLLIERKKKAWRSGDAEVAGTYCTVVSNGWVYCD